MGIFDQFFGKNKTKKVEDKSRYLPDEKKSKDLEFVKTLQAVEENSFTVKIPKALLFISNKFFKKTVGQKMTLLDKTAFYVLFKIDENHPNPKALVIHCEYLIANKGAILICNRQIEEKS